MKIGIITMPLLANYGGTLQNYALQQVLKSLGCESVTLRLPHEYQGISSSTFWFRFYPKAILKFLLKRLQGRKCKKPELIYAWRRRVSGMERFIQKYINITDYLPNLSMQDINRYDIDMLLVGSDQVWRPVKYDAEQIYFCGFAKDSNIKRIAYAPSIALDEWPFTIEVTQNLRHLINYFNAISVREESSVKLIKENLNVDAQWVLDPTMLLKKKDYLQLCKEKPINVERFIFAYILDMTDGKRRFIDKTAQIKNCKVLYLTADKVKRGDTIEGWMANFRDSQYVITDSYHGTVFSLIFNKDFYCFYNSKRGNARMDSLRKLTGINDRFIDDSNNNDISEQSIDYSIVDDKIERMRKSSIDFLKISLSV